MGISVCRIPLCVCACVSVCQHSDGASLDLFSPKLAQT